MFTLFNASAPSWNLFVLTLLEVTATAWLYGAERYATIVQKLDVPGKWRLQMKMHTANTGRIFYLGPVHLIF